MYCFRPIQDNNSDADHSIVQLLFFAVCRYEPSVDADPVTSFVSEQTAISSFDVSDYSDVDVESRCTETSGRPTLRAIFVSGRRNVAVWPAQSCRTPVFVFAVRLICCGAVSCGLHDEETARVAAGGRPEGGRRAAGGGRRGGRRCCDTVSR